MVAIDAQARRGEPSGELRCARQVYTHGGRRPAGRDAVAWAREVERLGAGEILLTSMDRDGTRTGYDLALTRAVAEAVSVPVIASGGVGTLEHLREGVVEGRADAVLAASIFHFGSTPWPEAKRYLDERGVPVRLGAVSPAEALTWDAQGLIPAVVQETETGQVLMVAWMSREALEATRRTGLSHFWSRSRQSLWRKGETSGHAQHVRRHLRGLRPRHPAGPGAPGRRGLPHRGAELLLHPARRPRG